MEFARPTRLGLPSYEKNENEYGKEVKLYSRQREGCQKLRLLKQDRGTNDAPGLLTEMLDNTVFFRLCCCKKKTNRLNPCQLKPKHFTLQFIFLINCDFAKQWNYTNTPLAAPRQVLAMWCWPCGAGHVVLAMWLNG